MIQLNELYKELDSVLDSKIKYCVLYNMDGCMIAYSGDDRLYSKNLSSLLANIWSGYDRLGSPDGSLESLILDCEDRKIVVVNIGDFNLCLVGTADASIGMIKLKVNIVF